MAAVIITMTYVIVTSVIVIYFSMFVYAIGSYYLVFPFGPHVWGENFSSATIG